MELNDIGVVLDYYKVIFLYQHTYSESQDVLKKSEALMCVLALPGRLNRNEQFFFC